MLFCFLSKSCFINGCESRKKSELSMGRIKMAIRGLEFFEFFRICKCMNDP
jgi:hypothetical protein